MELYNAFGVNTASGFRRPKAPQCNNPPQFPPSGQFHQSLTGLPEFFGHTSVSGERTQSRRSAVDEVTPVVLRSFVRHGAVDDRLSADLTRHEEHPHEDLQQQAEQHGVLEHVRVTTRLGAHSFRRGRSRLVRRKWPRWLTPKHMLKLSSVHCRTPGMAEGAPQEVEKNRNDIEPLLPLEEALAELPHGAQVGEIQLHVKDVEAAAPHLDLPHGLLSLVGVPAREYDAGASRRQGNGRLLANARITTCKNKWIK
ncbi:hypothetical protein EYF80_044033 [Liparis tanakae]|uniref:Uncharacterized protein n=1 Tax=Liparis tanakae TaxID=230148 RepID=A0A4Z2FXZ6_9TELE|nr:hypothetical protein EYF80_044033 [Liparis tanakae]